MIQNLQMAKNGTAKIGVVRNFVALDRHKKSRNWHEITGATPGFER
jgi:hypothetical protein